MMFPRRSARDVCESDKCSYLILFHFLLGKFYQMKQDCVDPPIPFLILLLYQNGTPLLLQKHVFTSRSALKVMVNPPVSLALQDH